MDRIEGVPEGYRLSRTGRVKFWEDYIDDEDGGRIHKWKSRHESEKYYRVIVPIEPEQQKQLEAVIVVPCPVANYWAFDPAETVKDLLRRDGVTVTIREREKDAK